MAVLPDKDLIPPAPPAPAVGSGTNQQNQGSTVAQAAAGQQKAQEPTAKIVTPGEKDTPQSNVPKTTSQSSSNDSPQTQTQGSQQQPRTTLGFSAPPPTPTYDNRPDPRTPEYYANLAALNATFGAQLGMLQSEQDASDLRYSQETMFQNEYQRRRRRDLAEARLGTGSAYTGSARRERAENDLDFAMEQARRGLDKNAEDNERRARLMGIEADRNQQIAGLDQEYVDRLNQSYQEESETSAGDREYTPDYASQIKALTNQIKKLQGQLKSVKDPKKRAKIKSKIDELKKQRATAQGKARGNG